MDLQLVPLKAFVTLKCQGLFIYNHDFFKSKSDIDINYITYITIHIEFIIVNTNPFIL